jgi:hypothetical protein
VRRVWRERWRKLRNLTTAEFRQQANAICSKSHRQLRSLGSPQSLEDLKAFVEDGLPIQEEGLKALKALNPPDELASDWNRFLALAEKDLSTGHELNDALNDGDGQRAQDAVAELGSLNRQRTAAARALNLTGCVNPQF